jgi:hypothetical protein
MDDQGLGQGFGLDILKHAFSHSVIFYMLIQARVERDQDEI